MSFLNTEPVCYHIFNLEGRLQTASVENNKMMCFFLLKESKWNQYETCATQPCAYVCKASTAGSLRSFLAVLLAIRIQMVVKVCQVFVFSFSYSKA